MKGGLIVQRNNEIRDAIFLHGSNDGAPSATTATFECRKISLTHAAT